jgi:pectate lyase
MTIEQRRHHLRIGMVVGIVIIAALGSWLAVVGLPSPSRTAATGTGTPPPTAQCTVDADVDSVPTEWAGAVVCLSGTLDSRLTISVGGTPDHPITYSGNGAATVRGIDVTASNVIVQGFASTDAHSMGAKLQGNNIVFRNNTIKHPVNAGDDTDGIRFFGDHIQILHNWISDVRDGADCTMDDGCGDGPHPDCFQTFYSQQYATSSDIVIDGNRCEQVAAQCLIAEGPNLPEDGIAGPGESTDWTFSNNYCDDDAAQALMIRDIKNVSITDNDFEGTNNKAIALSDGSTGAHVSGNTVNPRIPKLITFDDDNEASGYSGPQPDE